MLACDSVQILHFSPLCVQDWLRWSKIQTFLTFWKLKGIRTYYWDSYWHMWCLPPPAVARDLSLWLDLNPIITEQGGAVYLAVLLGVWPNAAARKKTCQARRRSGQHGCVKLTGPGSHIFAGTNTNWATGQIYSWEEQQAPSGLQQQKETRVHVKAASTHAGLSSAGGAAKYCCTFSESVEWERRVSENNWHMQLLSRGCS